MKQLDTKTDGNALQLGKLTLVLPALIIEAGKPTAKRFVEFFTANIRNPNTRDAYGRAVRDFFAWCDEHGIGPLIDIEDHTYRGLHRADDSGQSPADSQTTIGGHQGAI